jgi:hypothetical protein
MKSFLKYNFFLALVKAGIRTKTGGKNTALNGGGKRLSNLGILTSDTKSCYLPKPKKMEAL